VSTGPESRALILLEKAIDMVAERRTAAPGFPLFESIDNQLRYLRRLISREESDRRQLKHIVLGTYAVKEFEESDPEFATVLKEAQLIAHKMSKGLKV
jgi:hypothetical protein